MKDPRDRRIRELEQKVGAWQGCLGQKTLELDSDSIYAEIHGWMQSRGG